MLTEIETGYAQDSSNIIVSLFLSSTSGLDILHMKEY